MFQKIRVAPTVVVQLVISFARFCENPFFVVLHELRWIQLIVRVVEAEGTFISVKLLVPVQTVVCLRL